MRKGARTYRYECKKDTCAHRSDTYSRYVYSHSDTRTHRIIHFFLMMLNARNGKNIMDETYSYREKKDDA